MIGLTKDQRLSWEIKYRQKFGVSIRDLYGAEIDEWDDEDFYKQYHETLETSNE